MTTLVVFLHGSRGLSSRLFDILSTRSIMSVPTPGLSSNKTFLSQIHEYGYDLLCPQAIQVIHPRKADEIRYGWFDRSLDFKTEGLDGGFEDVATMQLSAFHICNTILEYERSKTHTFDHIIIGGMSRGGGMTLELLCYLHHFPSILSRLRGIFVNCSYLLKISQVYRFKPLPKVPILMLHGRQDQLIQYGWAKATAKNLSSCGLVVNFKAYPNGGHRLEPEMVSYT